MSPRTCRLRGTPPPDPTLPPETRQDGFSLVEVLAASVLLMGVMISIMTMFVFGGQHVNSGKLMTKAISIASDAQEQFRNLNYKQAYLVIEDGGTPAADTRYVWNSSTNTPNYPADADYQAILTDWKTQVEDGLPSGEMTITVRGLSGLGANPTETNFDDASAMQVVVTVRWKERKRVRSTVFETLKI